MRIVSLLPSATEIVCALGLREQLVGVTHECDFPDGIARLPHVTRTAIPKDATSGEIDVLVRERLRSTRALYTLDLELLRELAPDLIVTQGLCDVCAVAEQEVREAACSLPGSPRVVDLRPTRLAEVFDGLREVAAAAGVAARADDVVGALERRVAAIAARSERIERKPRVALLEWLDPPFSSGHWSPELVRLAGGIEGLGREGQPSRTLSWDEVRAWRPEFVLLACCGFDVERTLQDVPLLVERFRADPAWPGPRDLHAIDGSHYFSRPGPRLVDSLEILAHALHPDVHPLPEGLPATRRLDLGSIAKRR